MTNTDNQVNQYFDQ